MDSFNPYGRQQDPNYGPRSAAAAQQVHVGGGRVISTSFKRGRARTLDTAATEESSLTVEARPATARE